jgi:enediyne biosynthesis protein E4
MQLYFYISAFFALLCVSACKTKPTLFTQMEKSGVNFSNTITESKENNVFKYRNFYNGGGVATGDINNDGLTDIFFTANQGANKLFLNKGNFVFEDVSEKAGFGAKQQWSTGVVFVDINNDNWLDIYVCNAGNMLDSNLRANQLFINNKNGSFTDSAAAYGLNSKDYTTQASFFDYDKDGDLDCFMVNNSPIPVNTLNYANKREVLGKDWDLPAFLQGGGDRLYQNNNNRFTDVTKAAGLHGGLISLGLGATVADVNNDGYQDVYVSNDFFERDYLYINQKNGKFIDELEKRTQHGSLSSMGADMQDINNDGRVDIFTTDMLPADDYRLKANTSFENYDIFNLKKRGGFYNQFTQNALLVNTPEGNFLETAFYSGVAASDWSWGAMVFDADNDGLQDIYVCNGIKRDVTDQDFIEFFGNDVIKGMEATGKKAEVSTVLNGMPSNPVIDAVFKNNGNLKFTENGANWGITKATFSNGGAYADFDNDGDLDIVINCVDQPAMLYKNNQNTIVQNKFVALQLQYVGNNKNAIGSTVQVFCGNTTYTRQLMPSRGFQSSMEYKLTVGLGKNTKVDSVRVQWPNSQVSVFKNITANGLHTLKYTAENAASLVVQPQAVTTLLDSVPNSFIAHTEDDYVDYYAEKTVPYMLSKQGPKAAVADVNGDGLEDIFIGGARGQASQLYTQNKNGGYVAKPNTEFAQNTFNDVTAALFFDIDNDKDVDLFIGGGGNFSGLIDATPMYLNLLYKNDGKGNFSLQRGALPLGAGNCSGAVALDYNKDGFLDLCITNRSVPQNYGFNAPAFILQNQNGNTFTDVTKTVAPAFTTIGMVTAVQYADIDNDTQNELIMVGDYMEPTIFAFSGQQFTKKTIAAFTNIFGMWQTCVANDVDADGDVDLVLGNMGTNLYLNPTSTTPVNLWLNDFDDNGTKDKVMTRTVNGQTVPAFTKRDVTDQMPALKKMNLRHQAYAKKTIETLFPNKLKNAEKKTFNYGSSAIAFNDGKGNFTITEMPWQVQLSSVNAIAITDVNKDGLKDIILGGNFFDMIPQFCRADANYGYVLLQQKDKTFVANSSGTTGFFCKEQIRDIALLNKGKQVLVLPNNSKAQLYNLN